MKVTDVSQIRALQPTAAADAPRDAREKRDRVTTADADKVASAIADAARTAGSARAARLAQIESLVRQGVYRPDPQRIAQQILDEAEISARLQAMLK